MRTNWSDRHGKACHACGELVHVLFGLEPSDGPWCGECFTAATGLRPQASEVAWTDAPEMVDFWTEGR